MHATRAIPLLFGLWALGGCVIDQKLGETATEGDTGDDGDSGDPSAGTGTGGASQSNTSNASSDEGGQDGEGSDGAEVTSVGSSADDGGSTDDTGGMPVLCEADAEGMRWLLSDFDEPIGGVPASFRAVLAGDCEIIGLAANGPGPQIWEWQLDLACTLDGLVDAQEVIAEPYALQLDFLSEGIDPGGLAIANAEEVRIRLATDWWGMGWDAWFVIERPDGTMLMDGTQASYASPTAKNLSITEAVLDLLEGAAWHGDVGIDVVDTECTVQDKCGGEQRAIQVAWQLSSDMVLQVGQTGALDAASESAMVRASVWDATDYSGPAVCTDLPLGLYGVLAWLEEP